MEMAKKAGILWFIPVVLGLSLFLILFSGVVTAEQGNKPKNSEKITLNGVEMKKSHNFDYSVDKNTGKVTFINAIDNNKGLTLAEYPGSNPTPASAANQFVAEYGSYFGLLNPSEETRLANEKKDDLEMNHFWYDQKYKGIPVFAGQVAVHVRDNLSVSSANGIIVPDINIDTNPKISKEKAIGKAISVWSKQFKTSKVEVLNTELMIFNKGIVENKNDSKNYLVYEVELNKEPVRHEYYYVDAHSGDLIYQVTGTYNINRRIMDCYYYPYSGGAGCGLDTPYSGYTYGRSEGQSARGASPDATYGLTDTDDLYSIINSSHNYFSTKFSRNGANNQGGIGDDSNSLKENSDGWVYLDPVALIDPTFDCPNAFFDGFSINFCDGIVDPDVAAHEYAHGVVHYSISGGLTYTYESGALHEAYGDIFGAEVENYISGSGNWLMGENMNVPGIASPIRNLQNPPSISDALGVHPDRFYHSGLYCGMGDAGGVHHNSTVVSHAAYLMAEGGTHNTCTISAIGRDKMSKIFYRALTNYFTTNIDFNGTYNALVISCSDLYGSDSATCVNTRKALWATELNQGGACSAQARVEPGCADTTNPTVTSQNPANSASNMARNSNVYFELNDESSGVNPNSIDVSISGNEAITNGSCQSGYACTVESDNSNGYNVTINPDSDFDSGATVNIIASGSDYTNNSVSSSWSFTTTTTSLDPKILTTSGPGEVTRLQAYTRQGNAIGSEIKDIFPTSYLGGAGIIPIDANNNGVRDQIVVFASSNGGPQARVFGLKENGDMSFFGQMFVYDSTIRDGLSMTSGDFDGDGYQDDVATCLTGDRAPNVKIFKDANGMDNWEKIGDFTAPFGNVGCNVGTFQYDSGPPEILITPHHGPSAPYVYIYTVGGTLKEYFLAYGAGVTNGLTPSGIGERIYTTPNNGSSQINVFDRDGNRKNFWWAYEKHIRGDFKNMPGDIDLDGKDEILISPIGSNGPQVLAFEPTGKWRTWPNFFAFNDRNLRNGVGIAVIDNFHGSN